ncbi:MAG: Gfo/Idh/MocA family oxidoreductase [Actinomycetota bacterium]|nr:Gfo/Idh/MocA family oxidoreductase [Actinomycetota bacterium]
MATLVHLPVLLTEPGIRVIYVADISEPAVHRAARTHGCTPLVLDVGDMASLPHSDMVLLSVPVGARSPYYKQLAEHSTAVYAEKPVATTVEGAIILQGLFPDHLIACGFQRRYYANFGLLRRAVSEGWFGNLRAVVVSEGARTGATGVDWSFREIRQLSGGGILMDLGCHSLDLMQILTGTAKFEILEQQLTLDDEVDREVDLSLRCYSTEGNEVALRLTLSWLRPIPNMFRLDFDTCSLITTGRPDAQVGIISKGSQQTAVSLGSDLGLATTVNGAIRLAWRSLLRSATSGDPCPLSVASCLSTVDLIDQVYRRAGRS